ncbi:MAG TPA: hypothetical protein VKU39_12850 [Streptosporangiaceae bacterium]|nr:hypothetical protein [Streptosporangiaceae bacterium]
MSSNHQDAGMPPQTFLHKVAAAPALASDRQADQAPDDEFASEYDEPVVVHDEPALGDDETAPISGEREPTAMEPLAVRASDLAPERHDAPEPPDDRQALDRETRDAPQPPDSRDAGDGPLLGAAAGELRNRWRQVAASFVDDPRAAVSGATDVVSEAISRWRAAIRDREQALGGDADTEELRQAMLGYRRLLDTLLS